MKKSRLIFIVLIAGVLLSACGGSPAALSWPGITVDEANGTAYIAYNQNLYALQIENGTERWRFAPERDNSFQTYAPPELTEDGQLLVAGYNHALYSLDPANGGLNWSFNGAANRYVGSPLLVGDSIFAPNSDHKLYALSANGELQWTFGSQEPLWSQPASDGTTLFLTSMDHHIYAIDTESGEQVWEQDLGGTIVGSPALSEEGVLYVGTLNQEVVALDAANGRQLWSFATDGWVWSGPALFESQLFVGDLEGTLYALDASNGREIWRLDTSGAITGTPLVSGEHIYIVNENGDALSVTLEGSIQWTRNLESPLFGSPVQAGDLLLVGMANADTIVVALDANGNTVWSFIPEN